MPIVTLTTDWGLADFYLAALKGRILALCPQVGLVDVSHDEEHLKNMMAACHKLRHACPHFPAGSIHVVGVACEAAPLVLAEGGGHLFIAPNNGFLSLTVDNIACAVHLPSDEGGTGFTRMLSLVPRAVEQLLHGATPRQLGDPAQLATLIPRKPKLTYRPAQSAGGKQQAAHVAAIVGHVVHFDSNGNAITDITRDLLESSARGRPYCIYLNSERYKV
ncbi:MAG: SAM-dependent chlorinase/fluorinase, partial [Prevotellaceae bacterium]|nr:SAM-dependent chlorinase/fluorinase [Prevotellaceae bacterium]